MLHMQHARNNFRPLDSQSNHQCINQLINRLFCNLRNAQNANSKIQFFILKRNKIKIQIKNPKKILSDSCEIVCILDTDFKYFKIAMEKNPLSQEQTLRHLDNYIL